MDQICEHSAREANGRTNIYVTCDTYYNLHYTFWGCTCVFIDMYYTFAYLLYGIIFKVLHTLYVFYFVNISIVKMLFFYDITFVLLQIMYSVFPVCERQQWQYCNIYVHVYFTLHLVDVEFLDLCFTVACDKGVPLVHVLSTFLLWMYSMDYMGPSLQYLPLYLHYVLHSWEIKGLTMYTADIK